MWALYTDFMGRVQPFLISDCLRGMFSLEMRTLYTLIKTNNLMASHKKSLILCAVTLLLASCDSTASLRSLRKAEPSKDPFSATLSALYRDYAEEEEKNYDWWTSQYFANKGLQAAYGKDVQPEDPKNWNINAEARPAIEKAYSELQASLAGGLRTAEPERAARMIAQFDCWVEQAEDGWKEDKISACRDQFYANLIPNTQPVAEGASLSSSYILYFPWDGSNLKAEDRSPLDEVIAAIKAHGQKVEVVINGHADRSGGDDYNMELSQKRAEYIEQQMAVAGIPKNYLSYFAFGESDPKVTTADGVQESANRRVEIFIE